MGLRTQQGCIGLVECEPGITTCTCSVGGTTCSGGGDFCGLGNIGTCYCDFTCSGSGGGAMDYYYCSALTKPASCSNQSGAEEYCNAKGLCSVPGGCSWDDTGTPTPTPPPSCGNGSCDNGETCSTCPVDCGNCVDCIPSKSHPDLPKD